MGNWNPPPPQGKKLDPPLSHLCHSCPIFNITKGCFPVSDARPKDLSGVKYFFIGDAPQKYEVEPNLPFQGQAGEVIRECAEAAKVDLDEEAYITHGVVCPPRSEVGNDVVSCERADIDNCFPHALVKVALWRPKVILTVGGPMYLKMTGKKKVSIRKDHGQWFKMNLDFPTRYNTFFLWLRCRMKMIEELDEARPGAKAYYHALLNPIHAESSCQAQMDRAKEELGYDEGWLETECLPIVHPHFVNRQGRYGQWYESLKFDLEKARMKVDGTSYTEDELNYEWIWAAEDFSDYVDETIAEYEAGKIKCIAGDIETNFAKGKIGLSAFDPSIDLVSVQFSKYDFEARAILLQHRMSKCNDPTSMRMFRADLRRLLETVPSVWQNGKFDYNSLRCRLGHETVKDAKFFADTMLMDHWLNAGKGLFYNLDDMGARYCGTGKHKTPAKDWLAANPDKEFADMPLDIALGYACGDTDVTRRCYTHLRSKMERTLVKGKSMWHHYQHHFYGENKGWQVIVDLEYYGMTCDKKTLDALFEEYPIRMEDTREKLNQLPRMKEKWIKADYDKEVGELIELNATIELEHAELKRAREAGVKALKPDGSKLGWRRLRKIPTLEEYEAAPKNWFNPNSNPQCDRLWREILKIKFTKFTEKKCRDGVMRKVEVPSFTDLEYKDEECPKCRRKWCKCPDIKHCPRRPKATDHNREIIMDTIKQYLADKEGLTSPGLDRLRDAVHVIEWQSRFKKLSKLFGTYVKGIYPLIPDAPQEDEPWDPAERCNPLYKDFCDWPDPWRLHPSFHMNGTDTGRLSSSDPNGQNFPGEGDDDQTNPKLPYVSRNRGKGGLLLQPDYSQVEVRVMVVECGDEQLRIALNAGKDIHRFTTALVKGIEESEVTDKMRKPMKQVTFGILYGQGVASLAQQLHIPKEEGQSLMDAFFAQFPKVKQLVAEYQAEVKETNKVETRLGRVRWLYHVKSDNRGEANKALRDCVNTPIQSTASDLCWQSMGRVWQEVKDLGLDAIPFSIIHDSQTFDVHARHLMDLVELQFYQMVWRTMEMYPWFDVIPMADFSIGTSWGGLIDLKVFFTGEGLERQMDHHKIGISGMEVEVDNVCQELANGGLVFHQIKDGPHPQPEEADKGKWYRELRIERPEPKCILTGRNLIRS